MKMKKNRLEDKKKQILKTLRWEIIDMPYGDEGLNKVTDSISKYLDEYADEYCHENLWFYCSEEYE